MNLVRRIKVAASFLFNRYEGAYQPTYRSLLPTSMQGARFDLTSATRQVIAKKARYFEQNSALVNRLCDLFETYVVGPGIQFFPNSAEPGWNAAAVKYLDAWKPFADLSSLQGFDTLQGIIARALVIDGEIFVILTSGASGFPRIQLVESHRCYTPPDLVPQEGKSIVDGVAIDRFGRPTGYWFWEEIGTTAGTPQAKQQWRFIEASSVIHVFEPGRTGLYRGVSLLSPVINDLHDLDDLQLLEMRAARDAAEITNVLKNATGTLTVEEQMALGGIVQPQNSSKESLDATFTGGRNLVLNKDDDFQQFKSERPSIVTREYWDVLRNKVCQGVGIPLQIVDPSSQQGTTFRAAVDSSAAWFRCRFSAISVHLNRVILYVIGFGIRTDLTLADPPADWTNIQARPPRSLCVDLGYDSQAKLAELAAGMTTLEILCAERGHHWLALKRQRAIELSADVQLAAEFGLKPEQISAVSLPPPPTPSGMVPVPADDDDEFAPP